MEDNSDGVVYVDHFAVGEVADKVAQSLGVDSGDLLHEDQCGLSIDLYLWPE